MTKKSNILYINDILDNMNKIQKYTEGYNFDTFLKDEKTQDSVVLCIFKIGEAAKNLSKNIDNIETKYPGISWKDIIKMRDLIGHHYDAIEYDKLWNTIQDDIPKEKPYIEKLYEELKKEWELSKDEK
ncbi:MAG: DUF86 domain-containing protein [Elusimicrobiota bacterium]